MVFIPNVCIFKNRIAKIKGNANADITCKYGSKLCIFFPDNWQSVIILGDEIITNTSPTLIKLSPDETSFYLRIRGDQAQITLSEAYGSYVNAFTFTWGDGDDKSFTIRNQGTSTLEFSLNCVSLFD